MANVSGTTTQQQAQIDRLERMVTGLQDQIALLLSGLGMAPRTTGATTPVSSHVTSPMDVSFDTQTGSSKEPLSIPNTSQC